MSIKLSIIIPIYKEEAYIGECLSSLFEQIEENKLKNDQYEIIVVSDGASKEAEVEVLKFKDKFINFKFLKMKHKGAGTARNLGIKEVSGKYVAFSDADDKTSKGFLKDCNELLEEEKDLYIFGLRRIEGEKVEYWTVNDKDYNEVSEFADEYIKKGHLLIYSNCNKLYKSKIIRENDICFDESVHFGEDRLFNFDYLRHCHTIKTSSIIKHDYIKRKEISQSSKHYEKFFEIVYKLHTAKVKCFKDLSKNVSRDDIKKFTSDDLIKEINGVLSRFELHKNEEEENINLINEFVFEKSDNMNDEVSVLIVLGSRNCGYKGQKALELGKDKSYIRYIVSGGNTHMDGNMTEAEFMAKMLENNGISKDNIYIENKATNTLENLKYSYPIAKEILKNDDLKIRKKIGIITSAFHLKRLKLLVKKYYNEYFNDTIFISSLGPTVTLDAWYKNENTRNIIFDEIRKNIYEEM